MLNALFRVSKQVSSAAANETQMASFFTPIATPLLVLRDFCTGINYLKYYKIFPRRRMVFLFTTTDFSEKRASNTSYVKTQIFFYSIITEASGCHKITSCLFSIKSLCFILSKIFSAWCGETKDLED